MIVLFNSIIEVSYLRDTAILLLLVPVIYDIVSYTMDLIRYSLMISLLFCIWSLRLHCLLENSIRSIIIISVI